MRASFPTKTPRAGFDTSNLLSVDKFSGYDRVEGGGRANVGVQATTQFDRGGASRYCSGSPINCSA
jgi:lipopolysaccharide assembly outer membrane protein LptD (OstA)